MAKKRQDRGKERTQAPGGAPDLDRGFESPIRSLADLTPANIRAALVSSRYLQILLSLTIIGAFLRFFQIGYNSLWLDEASTLTISVQSIPAIWQTTTAGEFNPPLFYWVEHLMLVFGNSEPVLRFVPAVLGILTIPLVYLAGKEFGDRNVGIITAAAFTFSPFLLFYSQEARAYSMMLFFLAFSLVFFFRALKNDTTRDWVLFGILSALAFWSHFYALVMIGSLVLYALYVRFPKIRKDPALLKVPGTAVVVFLILCLPLIIVTVQLFALRTASAPTFGIPGPELVLATFAQIAGSDPALYIFLILFAAGIVQAFLVDRNKGIFLALTTLLTFFISVFLSYRIPMQPRYLIFLAIFFFMGIAFSYRYLLSLVKTPGAIYGFMALVIVVNAVALPGYYSGFTKEDWRGFSTQLQQITRPGDIVVAVPVYISQPLDYYYSNRTDQTLELGAYTAGDLANISARRNNSTVYYVVTSDIASADPTHGAEAWLEKNTKMIGGTTGIYLFASP